MSSTLCWKPVVKNGHHLPYELKATLQNSRRFGYNTEGIWHDGHISYLRGLEDAGVDGATELITAIEKYGEVELYLEY